MALLDRHRRQFADHIRARRPPVRRPRRRRRPVRIRAAGGSTRRTAMNRREFLQQTIAGGSATALALSRQPALGARVTWPIGCFNRPWTTWSFDDALKQIKAAGYQTTGLLTRTKDEPFIGADATPEYLARLKQRIAASGLQANMAALHSRHDIPQDESIKEVRRQIDHAGTLALPYLLTFGVD